MKSAAALILLTLAACEQAPEAQSAPKYVTQDFEPDYSKQVVASAQQVAELHDTAKAACLCVREKGADGKDACWNDFWQRANRYKSSGEWATACAVGSSAGIDFEVDVKEAKSMKVERTVMTEWPYGACSADEVPARKAEYEAKSGMRGC